MFVPKRVIFEPASLDLPLGKKIYAYFAKTDTEVSFTSSHNRVTGIPGKTPQEAYREGKATLVVGIRKQLNFQSCKPSAHYQLPLATGCASKCEYCYLMTNMGKKPYVRIYVNVDEILQRAKQYIDERKPEITIFEGAATSDPVAVEPYSGSLAKTVEFFGNQPLGRFRFVSKFSDIDSLLPLQHQGHTSVRFSINIDTVIKSFEHGTPPLQKRLEAAKKIAVAAYPLGLMIGPIIMVDNWEKEYRQMLQIVGSFFSKVTFNPPLTIELITHRFTAKAKNVIKEIFPNTSLPLAEDERQFKYGQFGYGKYLYPKEELSQLKDFFFSEIPAIIPEAKISYFV